MFGFKADPIEPELAQLRPKVGIPVLRGLQLYRQVFNDDSSKYANPAHWQDRIQYLILRPNPTPDQVTPDTPTYGFLAAIQRRELKMTTSHIWLTGVSKEQRGRGIFRNMLTELIEISPHLGISICIYPKRHPIAFDLVKNYGFRVRKRFTDGKVYLETRREHLSQILDAKLQRIAQLRHQIDQQPHTPMLSPTSPPTSSSTSSSTPPLSSREPK